MWFKMSKPIDLGVIRERLVKIKETHFAFSIELHPTLAKWKKCDPKAVDYYLNTTKAKNVKEAFKEFIDQDKLISVLYDSEQMIVYTFIDHTICDGVRGLDIIRSILDPSEHNQPIKLPSSPPYYPIVSEFMYGVWLLRYVCNFYKSDFDSHMFEQEFAVDHRVEIWDFDKIKKFKTPKTPTIVAMLCWYIWPLFERYPDVKKLSVCTIAAFDSKSSNSFNSYGFVIMNIHRTQTKVELCEQINKKFNSQKMDLVYSLQFMEYTKYIPGFLTEFISKYVRQKVDLCFTSVPVAKSQQGIGDSKLLFHGGCFCYMTSPLYAIGLTHGSDVFVSTTANMDLDKW
jgi:hypothetical protein